MDDERRVNDALGHDDALGRAAARPSDYRATLQLPKTGFPMKANLPAREPEQLARWEAMKLYGQIRAARRGSPQGKFILHDGPPYANGEIHIGHALNKTLKDIIVRYKTMRGFDAPYVPGWDCHGLPIEHALLKEMGKRKDEVPRMGIRQRARQYAQRFVGVQRAGFERLGIFGDWDRPYLTMAPSYQASIAECFFRLYERGYITRRLKPVPWCAECETALADAELEYETKTSRAIYVLFPVLPEEVQHRWPSLADGRPVAVVIWTTTPWTLPANVGLAFHPELTYCVVETGRGPRLLVAKDRIEAVGRAMPAGAPPAVVAQCLGDDLEGLEVQHPFLPRRATGILADFVSREEGTGIVHIAPGHGEEDYQVGHLQYGLPIISPVDSRGRFTSEFAPCAGTHVFEANARIVQLLQDRGALLGQPEPHQHSYPHCWRCKNPIIFRATQQWFLMVDHDGLRAKAREAVERQVRFVPAWGKNRIGSMLETRPDWCVSRQRAWGVPIPAITCEGCGQVFVSELRDRVLEAFRQSPTGADVWFERSADEWARGLRCACAQPRWRREDDILDVWFDSGASHHAVLMTDRRDELTFPADLYLEGSDQHRGWFQSSLIVALGVHDRPPFTGVLTHGFVVDGDGRKMSKSLGNVIAPQEVLKTHGADILRLWVAASDYTEDIRLSPQILDQTAELYRKIRNTVRYVLGNLADFDPSKDGVAPAALTPVDRWAVGRAAAVVAEATAAYEAYEFHKVVRALSQFCTVDLSNFYLDVLKDRLYTWPRRATARRSAQTALWRVYEALVKVAAPLLPFTTEEAWEAMGRSPETPSVHLADWLSWTADPDPAREASWAAFFAVREVVLKALEVQRIAGAIGDPAEAAVIVTVADPAAWAALQPLVPSLAELLLVSEAQARQGRGGDGPVTAEVRRAAGTKCARCWRYTDDVGQSSDHPGLCGRCVEALLLNERVSR